MKILLFLCFFGVITKTLSYEWETRFIEMPLDHFNFLNMKTFSLRYLVNDTHFKQGGPIFIYTGNEGDIEGFAKNTGFLFDIFEQFNALLVFAEHRYYGKSLPFGNLSYSAPEYLGYLSSQQALADYVYLIDHLQKTYTVSGDTKLPVFAFGGSYGGMLAAWIRMKYPYAVTGALASSAPIWQFPNLNKTCSGFYDIITDVYVKHGSEHCKNTLKNAAAAIEKVGTDEASKQNLTATFGLCKPLSTQDDLDVLQGWIGGAIVNLVEINYPYPADFLANLPGWPVKEFCKKIDAVDYSTDEGLVQALGDAMQLYSNFSQTVDCVDIFSTSTDIGDEGGWGFQVGWRLTGRWIAGNAACKFVQFLRALGPYLSSNVLICVALDRYFAVMYPFTVNAARNRGKVMLFVAWGTSLIYCIPQCFIFRLQTHPQNPDYTQCVTFGFFLSRTSEMLYNFACIMFLYFIPLTVILVAYSCIMWELSRNSKLSHEEKSKKNPSQNNVNPKNNKKILCLRRSDVTTIQRAKIRTLRMTISIILVYLFCCTPYVVMTLWYMVDRESAQKLPKWIQDLFFLMVVSNSCMNPIVYGSYVVNFQKMNCKTCLSRLFKRNEDLNEGLRHSATRSSATHPLHLQASPYQKRIRADALAPAEVHELQTFPLKGKTGTRKRRTSSPPVTESSISYHSEPPAIIYSSEISLRRSSSPAPPAIDESCSILKGTGCSSSRCHQRKAHCHKRHRLWSPRVFSSRDSIMSMPSTSRTSLRFNHTPVVCSICSRFENKILGISYRQNSSRSSRRSMESLPSLPSTLTSRGSKVSTSLYEQAGLSVNKMIAHSNGELTSLTNGQTLNNNQLFSSINSENANNSKETEDLEENTMAELRNLAFLFETSQPRRCNSAPRSMESLPSTSTSTPRPLRTLLKFKRNLPAHKLVVYSTEDLPNLEVFQILDSKRVCCPQKFETTVGGNELICSIRKATSNKNGTVQNNASNQNGTVNGIEKAVRKNKNVGKTRKENRLNCEATINGEPKMTVVNKVETKINGITKANKSLENQVNDELIVHTN